MDRSPTGPPPPSNSGTPPPGSAASNAPAGDTRFRSLDPVQILRTAVQLEQRVRERFPGSGLSRVAVALAQAADEIGREAVALSRPIRWLRVLSRTAIVVLIAIAAAALTVFRPKDALYSSVADYFQGLDAAVNELVLLGIAIYFFLGLERRIKRRRALASLHSLRSTAHIIDMHQLTKDPDRWIRSGPDTPSSPQRTMTAFELTRYLDYCAEMLALLSKLAALHVQDFDDPVTLSAVNDIENLTSDLSRKIWQKIMILDRLATED